MKNQSKWNWYGVRIIKQIVVIGEPDKKLIEEAAEKYGFDFSEDDKQSFEESIMLVKAQSFNHAYKISEKKSLSSNVKYPNMYGQEVEWKFVKAVDCFEIMDVLKSGAEVYSCFHSTDRRTSVEEFIDKWFCSTEEGCKKARHL